MAADRWHGAKVSYADMPMQMPEGEIALSRFWIFAVLLALFVALGASTAASAGGVSPAKLVKAGWDCIVVFGAVHCAPPGGLARVLAGTAKTMTFNVFAGTDPTSEDAPFLGTEIIKHYDIFHGEPCPTDPPTYEYTDLGSGPHDIGLDYFACHHYDSSF